MATEQPESGSATVEDRLAAYFATQYEPTSEPAPKAAPAQPTPEAATAEEDQQQEQESDAPESDATEEQSAEPTSADFVEVSADDGTTHKVPAALKDAFLRNSDYTRKTQELAAVRKSAEDKLAFADTKEQVFGAVLQDIVNLRETQAQLDQLNKLDWAALYNADPGQALSLRNRMDTLSRQVNEQQQTIATKAKQFEDARKAHQSNQWKSAVDAVKAKIGSVSTAEDNAMLRTVQDLGFSQEELTSRFADPRFLHAIYLASKYQSLQSSKPGAIAAVSKAPPVVAPGAVKQSAPNEKRIREVRSQFKKSGSIDDFARLLVLKG